MKALVALLAIISSFGVNAIWIGEEFWTTIHYDGRIENGRSTADFVHFKNLRNYDEIVDYVAYWIVNDVNGHYETYGEAYEREDGRICGRFVARTGDFSDELCGGFRILSRGRYDGATPFEWQATSRVNRPRAVEYLSHEIARVVTKQRVASIFGGVDLDHGTAYCVDTNGTVVHIRRNEDPEFYDENVEVLIITPGYEPKPWEWYFRDRPYPQRQEPPVRYEPPPAPPVVTHDNLPHIFHSDRYDPSRIIDSDTWHRNHPNYRPRPFDDTYGYDRHEHERRERERYLRLERERLERERLERERLAHESRLRGLRSRREAEAEDESPEEE